MFDLNKQINYEWTDTNAKKYLDKNGILTIIEEFREKSISNIPPSYPDLARLHSIVKGARATTTWEFGVGFSTLVFAHAISINKKDFDVSGIKFTSFGHSAIEAETRWIRHTKNNFPNGLLPHVDFLRQRLLLKLSTERHPIGMRNCQTIAHKLFM